MTANRFNFAGQGLVSQPEEPNWNQMQPRLLAPLENPAHYHVADPGLVEAVNTALLLGMPLLLTGEPGVGKTQLAYRIAYELGCETIYFPVKSTSTAQDLFYSIDHLRRLHAAQAEKNPEAQIDIRRFLRFEGLGLAILRAMPPSTLTALNLADKAWTGKTEPQSRQPSLVLIDEIDKAPLDFCNDMLEEVRRLQFTLPELGEQPLSIYADPNKPDPAESKYRPQLVITSNSEKGLPEPFLRRCVYYHIQPPSEAQLRIIVKQRLGGQGSLPIKLGETAIKNCVDFFLFLKDQNRVQLEKSPSTAELLNWLLILDQRGVNVLKKGTEDESWKSLAKSCLLKGKEDTAHFEGLLQQWHKPS